MDVHRSIDIEVPAERVWPLLVEPDKIKGWFVGLREFRYLDEEPRGPGTHVHMEEKAVGPMLKEDFEVTEWTENHRLRFHMTSGSGVKKDDQVWSLDPTPTGCRFTFEEHVELPYGPLGSVLGVVGQRGLRSHVAEMLGRLKELAEA
jgi:uncharacterized protein YndB with AHSA1/START domain